MSRRKGNSHEIPEKNVEEDVREDFTDVERRQGRAKCLRCHAGSRLVRVYGVAYFHAGIDGLGGIVPCQARHLYQEFKRAKKCSPSETESP